MKYKLTVTTVVMVEGVSALKCMNALMETLKGRATGEEYRIRVEYLSNTGWKLENSLTIR